MQREKTPNKGKRYLKIYGFMPQDYYTEEDIRRILKEMESISGLFPINSGKMKLIGLHSKWRKKYYKYWIRKWFFKVRRRS